MGQFFKKNFVSLLFLLLLALSLPLTVTLAQKAWQYLTSASYQPANIVVLADQVSGSLRRPWAGLSQGHEAKDLRLETAVPMIKPLGIAYIRIDHVLNGFDVVSRTVDGKLSYDWTKLDLLIGDIVRMGATPFISLSYMPPVISRGDITELPKDYGEYAQVIASYVGRYSRDYKGGLNNVIYEVWNEPDLFGGFKTYGDKNYLTLYRTASNAAASVKNAKPFLIGGPATTGFYPNWAIDYYKNTEGVRKDFFSWHRYSSEVSDFVSDAKAASETISPLITGNQQLFITEWGIKAERGNVYDSNLAASHFAAVSRALLDTNIDLALAFEVQDGTGGEGKFHGGWGILTNPKYGDVAKKPRYRALELVSKMQGDRLTLFGEGSDVVSFAARDVLGNIRVLVVNYDPKGKHEELVPVTVSGLSSTTNYVVTEEYLTGRKVVNELMPENGMIKREIMLRPSEVVLLSFSIKSN